MFMRAEHLQELKYGTGAKFPMFIWPMEYFWGEISQGTGILREVEAEAGPLYLQCFSSGAPKKTRRKKSYHNLNLLYAWRRLLAHVRKTDLSRNEEKDHHGEFLVYIKGHTAEDLSSVAKPRPF